MARVSIISLTARGRGKSKKAAESDAVLAALQKLREKTEK